MTVKNKKSAYRGYLITRSLDGAWYFVTRDGHNICTAKSIQEAHSVIDTLFPAP